MQTIEIDEDTREIRVGARALSPQPKVFELLAYLARHRMRVVPKSELLDAVWPGVVVTEASLQRAISLARTALTELEAAETIATHARHGYRFHDANATSVSAPAASVAAASVAAASMAAAAVAPAAVSLAAVSPAAVAAGSASVLVQAREAYERGEWEQAIGLLQSVDDLEGLGADDLQRWAHSAQCLARPADALRVLERAVVVYSARGDERRAAWAAILNAHLRLEWGEGVLANGWVQRAARLLENTPDCREKGYIEMLRGRLALASNDLARTLEHGLRARELGRAFADPDLEGLGLMQMGQAWLFTGNTQDGLNALDEAAVAVGASGLSAWAGGLVYCGVIFSYMTRSDWQRAGQWTTEFTRWCEGKGVAAYPGLCRMHRAEVLAAGGQLPEAVSEMHATLAMLGECAPWAQGDGFLVLGEILLVQGSFDEARAAFVRAAELGWDSTFGLALVRYYEGDVDGALRQLGQCMEEEGFSCRIKPGASLAYMAMVAAAAGQLERARTALEAIARRPDLTSTPLLGALVARARGELQAAEGDRGEAIRSLRAAARSCHGANSPLACAEVRRSLARVLIAERDFDAAEVELASATSLFRRAGAGGQVNLCEAIAEELRAARSLQS